jgi:hypothetical protein
MGLFATLSHLFHPQRSNNHRPRVLHPEGFLVLVTLTVVFVLSLFSLPQISKKAGNVLGFSSSITPDQVITQTNNERQKVGMKPLKSNRVLNEAALAKAQDMLSKQYWSHNAPDGTQPWTFFKKAKYDYSVAGENLARDFSNTSDMMSAWMNSPTHKANIVHGKYTEIGIAVVDGKLNGVETTLVVQFFGTPVVNPAQITDRAEANLAKLPAKLPAAIDATPVISFAEEQAKVFEEYGKNAAVLSSESFKLTELSPPPLFSPLQLTKAFFMAILCIVVVTLLYDMFIMKHKKTARLVGNNLAHLIFLLLIAFLVVYFKSGVIS